MITPQNIQVLIPEEQVNQRIIELAEQIDVDYAGRPVRMFCVLNGAMHFFCTLTQHITKAIVVEDSMRVSSYGTGFQSTGNVNIMTHPNCSVANEDIIIVEDIIDSGHTMAALLQYFQAMNPHSIKVCSLLDKPCRREVPNLSIDYCGFTVDDKFIVGYGLDVDRMYRNLPYIGYIP